MRQSPFFATLFVAIVVVSPGCVMFQNQKQQPPNGPIQPIVPPIVIWDSSYAEPMGTPQTATVRRGIIKVVCHFPDEGENPKWVKGILEYRGDQQDSAIARMLVFSNIPGVYTLELVGAGLSPREIVHIEWLTQQDQRGSYDILVEHGVMRPLPSAPTNMLNRP